MPTWHRIPLTPQDLHLPTTLRSGQSFRWKLSGSDTYSCALRGRLISVRQDDQNLYFKFSLPPDISVPPESDVEVKQEEDAEEEDEKKGEEKDDEQEVEDVRLFLRYYFNLDVDLRAMYKEWAAVDGNFRRRAGAFGGVRVLRQDAWEAVVGFVCSSCNNIKRIMQMMDKLCANYGPLVGYVDDVPYYDMPSAAALLNPRVKEHLRELGFGYRAAYLYDTAHQVMREKPGWLDLLRNPESPVFGGNVRSAGVWKPEGRDGYKEAHEAMTGLRGVGDKVADCVCLFGLGWGEAVPVDTHVWQIAQRDYGFGKGKHKSLTKATYGAVANHFRNLWGKEAGWAHSVLFTADLRDFAGQAGTTVVKTETTTKIETKTKTQIKTETTVKTEYVRSRPSKNLPLATPIPTYTQTTVKEEFSSHNSSSLSSRAPEFSSDEESIFIKPEIKVEAEEEVPTVTTIRKNKRRADTLVTEENTIVKTEAVGDSGKRRRSSRLRR